MANTNIDSFLPIFPGFYETGWQYDSEELIMDEDKTYDDYEWNYKPYMKQVVDKSVNFIEKILKDAGLILGIKDGDLRSPREYNFVNDTINVTYTRVRTGKIRTMLRENIEEFQEYLNDKYTPRSGFIPFHSTNPQDWINNVDDSHKFGAILEFLIPIIECMELEKIEMEMHEMCTHECEPEFKLKQVVV